MSKKFKSQASSSRAASGSPAFGFGASTTPFQTSTSPLAYLTELPDLAGISDPSVVVSFKNLTKKDGSTKAKALEELQADLAQWKDQGTTIEHAVLDAWINIYPRTSVDNSRRVRQLAHSVQGTFTGASGKRIAPHLPKVVGAWLSGTFDADKSVARSAKAALETGFPTKEKERALWKIYRTSLVEYAEEAILRQTPQTISDERTTSPDDAEAKHVRVVGNALLLACELLRQLESASNNTPAAPELSTLLGGSKLWGFAYHSDPSVRRAIYSLVALSTQVLPSALDWDAISTCFVAKSLHISQLGSSRQFVDALLAITRAQPLVWTDLYHAKVAASKRLSQFLRQGSQRGPEMFWPTTTQLIKTIPPAVWSRISSEITLAEAKTILECLHDGVVNPDESRPNASAAWSAYLDLSFWIASFLGRPVTQQNSQDGRPETPPPSILVPLTSEDDVLLELEVFPIVQQFISASGNNQSLWGTPGGSCVSAHFLGQCAYEKRTELLQRAWTRLSNSLIESLTLSLAETSKDFKISQEGVTGMGKRYSTLQLDFIKRIADVNADAIQTFGEANTKIICEATEVLRNRHWKPYGAAAVLDELSTVPNTKLSLMDEQIRTIFLSDEVLEVIASPSAERLVSMLLKCRGTEHFDLALQKVLAEFVRNEKARHESPAFHVLLKNLTLGDIARNPALEQTIMQDLTLALNGDKSKWNSVCDVVKNPLLGKSQDDTGNSSFRDRIITQMMASLSVDSQQSAAISGFDTILQRDGLSASQLPEYLTTALMPKLLILSNSPHQDIADHAETLAARVKNSIKTSNASNLVAESTMELIRDELRPGTQHMSVLGLVDLGQQLLGENPSCASDIFPTTEQWQAALVDFLNQIPIPASAIVSPFLHIVNEIVYKPSKPLTEYDSDGFSQASRLVFYVTRLLKDGSVFYLLTSEKKSDLFLYYPVVLKFVSDKLTIDASNKIWSESSPEIIEEMVEILADGQKIIAEWIKDDNHISGPEVRLDEPGSQSTSGVAAGLSESRGQSYEPISSCWISRLADIGGMAAKSYHLGVVLSNILSECVNLRGFAKFAPQFEQYLFRVRTSDDLIRSAALITICKDALGTSSQGIKLCNELVTDATDLSLSDHKYLAYRPIYLLDILLVGNEGLFKNVSSQRLVFLLKNLVALVEREESTLAHGADIFDLMRHTIGNISELSGEHWENILAIIQRFWHTRLELEFDLPAIHSSLRLMSRLRTLEAQKANEGLVEAWKSAKISLDAGLVNILTLFAATPIGANQPRAITTELLRRQFVNVSMQSNDILAVLPLLRSGERPVQTCAFDTLHTAIPQAQQQNSLDVALDRKILHLPKDLLSMLVEAPSMSMFGGAGPDTVILWMNVRQYLLSWKIAFDHFTNASHKLQEMYVDDIKRSGCLPPLLALLCDLLRITSGRPVDASKFDIDRVTLDVEESLEKEVQWLSAHLYHLCLANMPGLAKEWFIQQSNRIKAPLEAWTQKYISHSITTGVLATVLAWAGTQDSSDRPVTIKTSPRGSELVASIAIDDESPPIALAISLPGAFPLEPAIVTSRSRVGVSEKNWQSWLRTIQIIIFSTGSIVDGLIAFRRNVQGALKGQTECAICYSIIGEDMQTPNKTCGTCKNNFHGVCLFKWFKKSNSNTCPLCRNQFNYA